MARHFGTELGTPKPAVFALEATSVRRSALFFDPPDANFLRIHLDGPGQRAEVVTTAAAQLGPHAPARLSISDSQSEDLADLLPLINWPGICMDEHLLLHRSPSYQFKLVLRHSDLLEAGW